MHLIQTLIGCVVAPPSRPGRLAALEYSLVAGIVIACAGIASRLMMARLAETLAQLPL